MVWEYGKNDSGEAKEKLWQPRKLQKKTRTITSWNDVIVCRLKERGLT